MRARPGLIAVVMAVAAAVLGGCATAAPTSPAGPATSPGQGSTGSVTTGHASTGQASTSPDVSGPVDLGGGRTVYLQCRGSGDRTVVLLSGLGNAGDIWEVADAHPPAVFAGVAAFARVCTYDRPGSYVTTRPQGDGRVLVDSAADVTGARGSLVAPMPRTGSEVVGELHQLLGAAGVAPPYVLVGHSLGGLFTVLYARTYPAEVSGIVLVDPTTPTLQDALPAAVWAGIGRAIGDPGPSIVPGYVNESYRLDETVAQLASRPALPAAVPVTDLIKTLPEPLPDPLPAGASTADLDEIQRVSPAAQAAWVSSMPGGGVLIPVPQTTHYLQNQRPDVVVAAVRAALEGRTLAASIVTTPAGGTTSP